MKHQAAMAMYYIDRALDSDGPESAKEEFELAIDELCSLGVVNRDWAEAMGWLTLAKVNIDHDLDDSCYAAHRAYSLLDFFVSQARRRG